LGASISLKRSSSVSSNSVRMMGKNDFQKGFCGT
jgi:hypothetical protein